MEISHDQQPIRVFVALSAPLSRARLRNILQAESGIQIVGEAGSGALAAERAVDARPQILLLDDRILEDPAITMFAKMQAKQSACLFVLVAPQASTAYRGPIPLATVVTFDSTGSQMREWFEGALMRQRAPAPRHAEPLPVTGMSGRFVVTGDRQNRKVEHSAALVQADLTAAPVVRDQTRTLPNPETLVTRRLSGGGRRQESESGERIVTKLNAVKIYLEQQRDQLTGLYNTKVLGGALRALPEVGYPAAIAVLHLWLPERPGTQAGHDALSRIIRSAAAMLRANVRLDDVVCRLEGAAFAVVMPGLNQENSDGPVQRLRMILERFRSQHSIDGVMLEMALGVAYWSSPMPAAEPLQRAWQEMLADREEHQSARN